MDISSRLRLAGVACALGGAVWCLALLLDPASGGAVRDTETRFRIWEAILLGAQVLLFIGVLGLAVSDAIGGWLGGRCSSSPRYIRSSGLMTRCRSCRSARS